MNKRALATVFLGFVLGCGGGGSSGGGVSVDQLLSKYGQIICTQNFKCCTADDLSGKTMSTCVSNYQTLNALFAPSLKSSIAKGRVKYDGVKMAACLDAFAAESCDTWKNPGMGAPTDVAACDGAFTPLVPAGGACQQDGDCITGACDGADDGTVSGTPKDGTCAAMSMPAPVATGASCASAKCGPNDYCDSATVTCQKVKAAGEVCDDPSSSTSDSCASGNCNTTTGKCSCYAGCAVAGPVTTTGVALSATLAALALVAARCRRRPRERRSSRP